MERYLIETPHTAENCLALKSRHGSGPSIFSATTRKSPTSIEAENGVVAVDIIQRERPGLVFLDARQPYVWDAAGEEARAAALTAAGARKRKKRKQRSGGLSFPASARQLQRLVRPQRTH